MTTTTMTNAATKRPMRVNKVADENDLPVRTVGIIAAVMVVLVAVLVWAGQGNQLDRSAPLIAKAAKAENDARLSAKQKLNMAARNLGY